LGSAVVTNQTATVALSSPAGLTINAGIPANLIVAFDVAPTATIASTLQASLFSNGYVTLPAGNDVVAKTNFPARSNTTEVRDGQDSLTLTGSDKAPVSVQQAQTNVPMLQTRLSASSDDVTITSVALTKTGAGGVDGDVTQVRLYWDVNGDGAPDAGDQLLGSGVFTGGVTAIGGMNFTVAQGADRYLLMTYDISPTATEGATMGVRLANNAAVVVSNPDVVASTNFGTNGISSGTPTVQSGVDSLRVTAQDLAPATVLRGDLGTVMAKLTLTTQTGTVTVNALKVSKSGTSILDNDVAAVKLYLDANANGKVDVGELQVGSSATFSAGVATVNISAGLKVGAGDAKVLLVTYDIGVSAIVGNTIGVSIPDQTAFVVGSPDTVSPNGLPFTSTASLVQSADSLTVTLTNLAPATALQGADRLLMGRLSLTMAQGLATVVSLKIKQGGNSTSSADVTKIRLWWDENNNNQVDVIGDVEQTVSDTGGVFDANGEITFALAAGNQTVTPAQPKRFLVAYNLGLSATVGNTVAVELTDDTFVTAGAATVAGAFPLLSTATQIQQAWDVLNVKQVPLAIAAGAVPQQAVVQGQTGVPLLRIRLEASSGTITVNTIRLRRLDPEAGTENAGADADLSLIRIYENLNENDEVDPGEVELANGSFFTGVAALTVAGGYDVSVGQPRDLLVTVNVSDTAQYAGGNVLGDLALRMEDNSYVSVTPNDIVRSFDNVITSHLLDIQQRNGTLTAQRIAVTSSATATQGETNVPMLGVRLVATLDTVGVTALTVGLPAGISGLPTDVVTPGGVKVYKDTNKNGTSTRLRSPPALSVVDSSTYLASQP